MSEPILIALIGAAAPIVVAIIQALMAEKEKKPGDDGFEILVPSSYEQQRKRYKPKPKTDWLKILFFVFVCSAVGYLVGLGMQDDPRQNDPQTSENQPMPFAVSACAQQVHQDVFDRAAVIEYLRDVFFWWTLTGDTRADSESDKALLSAFHSVLNLDEMAIDKPEETMKSWIDYTIDQAIIAGVCTTKEQCAFLDFDTTGAADSLSIEESFWRLWEHVNGLPTDDIKPKNMAAIRLALIALVGEDCQRELIGKWNSQLQ